MSVCVCVHTLRSRFGSQVFRRGHLALIGHSQKKASRKCINGNNNNNNKYQNNILHHFAGLDRKINRYLSIVSVTCLRSCYNFKSSTAAAMVPQGFGAKKREGKIWGKGQVSVLPWQWPSPWPSKAAKRSKDIEWGAWSSCRLGDLRHGYGKSLCSQERRRARKVGISGVVSLHQSSFWE